MRGCFIGKALVFYSLKIRQFFNVVFDGLHGVSSHSPGGGFVRPVPGCAALVPLYCAGCTPALVRVLYARTAAQIARGRQRVFTCKRAGAGVRGGLSHALPPGGWFRGGCPPARYLYNTTVCTFRQGRKNAVLVHFRRFGTVKMLLAMYFIVFRLFALVFAVFTNNGKTAVESYNLLIKFIFVNIWVPGRRSRDWVLQWCERGTR